MFAFIWQTKVEKVKRKIMTRQFDKGGVNMIDLQNQKSSFRLRWLGRALAAREGIWNKMCLHWFNVIGGLELLFNSDFEICNLKFIGNGLLPSFYEEILEAWVKIKKHAYMRNHPTVHGIHYEILWHNSNVKFNNNTLYYKEWFKNGIVFLGDVFKNGSFIPVKDIFSLLKAHWSKQNLIFDYARLRHAIPKAWLRHYNGDGTLPTQRHDNVSLEIPCIRERKCRAKVYMM